MERNQIAKPCFPLFLCTGEKLRQFLPHSFWHLIPYNLRDKAR